MSPTNLRLLGSSGVTQTKLDHSPARTFSTNAAVQRNSYQILTIHSSRNHQMVPPLQTRILSSFRHLGGVMLRSESVQTLVVASSGLVRAGLEATLRQTRF